MILSVNGMSGEGDDNQINCVNYGSRYELPREECPKCGLGNYRYDKFSASSNFGESQKEIDTIIVKNPKHRYVIMEQ
jgi:hypothetical protein